MQRPPLPGVSRFRRIGSHLRRVTWAPGPTRWQLTPGNRRPPAQHKSIAGGRLFRAPHAIVPGLEPESRGAGVSRFRRSSSHLAVAGAAEGHAGQVDGPGSSRNAGTGSHPEMAPVTDAAGVHVTGPGSSEFTKNGSHPAAADFSNDPGAFLCRRPHRAVQNQASCCTGRPRWAVRCRKWPCGVREARLSIGGCARRWQQEQVRRKAQVTAGTGQLTRMSRTQRVVPVEWVLLTRYMLEPL